MVEKVLVSIKKVFRLKSKPLPFYEKVMVFNVKPMVLYLNGIAFDEKVMVYHSTKSLFYLSFKAATPGSSSQFNIFEV